MKKGSLILSLFLISILFISGCEELQEDITSCITNYQESCSEFDLNEDGFVNILDLVIATSGRSFDFTGQDIRGRGTTMSIQGISTTSGAGTLEIDTTSTEDIYGFQFSLTGLYVSGASGGIATSNGYMFSVGCDGECVVGFNFDGNSISTTDLPGVLVEISFSDHHGGEVCFKPGEGASGPYNVISGQGGVELTTSWVDNCGGEGISGCNDQTACNYDADVTIPDGSCEYAEDNFDCDGNCVEEVDCTGECGGSAYEDNCGVCDIYPSNDDSTCTGCTDQNACNYDPDAVVPCTSLLITSVQEESKEGSSFWHKFVAWWMQFKVNENIQRSDVYVEEVIGALRENECCEYPPNYPDNVYDCNGNCIEDTDCFGTCGGNSVVDPCGVCGADGSTCTGCTDPIACNYDQNNIIDDGSCVGGFPNELTTEPGGEGCWCTNDVWNVDYFCRFVEPKGTELGLEYDLFFSDTPWQTAKRTMIGYCQSRLSYDKIIKVVDHVCSTEQVEEGYEYYATNPGDETVQDQNGYHWKKWDGYDGHCDYTGDGIYLQEFTCVFRNCVERGDLNGDGFYNVLDVVILAGCVLNDNCEDIAYTCAVDMNHDGGYNVLDLVTLANCILASTCYP